MQSVSKSTLKRLPIYLHYLKTLVPLDQQNISATQISQALGLGEVLVRKDLASISNGGRPKIGYEVHALIATLEDYLGVGKVSKAVIVGVGRLGQALMMYKGFGEFGLEIVAGFDVRPSLGVGGKPVYDVKSLSSLLPQMGASIGIITVPAAVAQDVADELIRAGVKGIWNFSPVHIVVPQAVAVKNENLAASLAVLSKQIK